MDAMDHTEIAPCARHDIVIRLRQQVASGAYEPPVDEIVDEIVRIVLARQRAGRVGPGAV